MKKILIIHYSQTGQLTDIVNSITAPLKKIEDVCIVYEEIKPRPGFDFPWSATKFCDVFPESVEGIPCEIEPVHFDPNEAYDLVILAYQVWFLAPSLPITAFLDSSDAKVMKGRPVLTIIGCRNMWLLAHETVKQKIVESGGRLFGNIVLGDKTGNLLGVLTITIWMLSGKKKSFLGILPDAGISDQDIYDASKFGDIVSDAVKNNDPGPVQNRLNAHGAVTVVPQYILFEKRIHRIFKVWSRFILKKGKRGNPGRKFRVRLFLVYLFIAIAVIAPVSTVLSMLAVRLKKDEIQNAIGYFSENTFLF
ncbi:dialkylrecorsinol condensing enzyme [uncultured Desulfobacter sp.]|uniref:dialkylrecorsinol condensing enzyme n=1 Tax=uncultured Desulfobacter sp. TaxID=240139 RepID=UPI002AAB0B23|nr:dialkylrecorsinol condensing enzyme [uncultured Desulfobacter sp.]